MDINNIQGATPYVPSQAPNGDTTLIQDQNREAARAELDRETARTAREAFEVNISQDARERLQAAEASEAAPPQDPTPAEPYGTQSSAPAPGNDASRIVNIVA